MSDQYIPTTEQVRDGFRFDELAEWYDPVTPHHVINGRAFDRWLAAVETAAEQRGAIKALRDAANLSRACWAANKNLRDPDDPEVSYSFDRWLEVRADQLEAGGVSRCPSCQKPYRPCLNSTRDTPHSMEP